MAYKQSLSDVTGTMLEFLRDSGLKDSYLVVPSKGIPYDSALSYWNAMYNADTLKYRWSDVFQPTAEEVMDYYLDTPHTYFVVDTSTLRVSAEFALCNFTGKAAQIHFSMHPANGTKVNIFLADEVTNIILSQWHDIENLEESYVDTLFGITPVNNRPACIFIRKAGFKAIGTLLNGTKYLGKVTDALLTTKSRLI